MRSLILAAALAATYSVPADARMEVAMQDDNAIVHQYSNRELALQQFVDMGGTSVRINFIHRHGKKADLKDTDATAVQPDLSVYDSAVNAVLAHNLKPQLTLYWADQLDPARFAEWTAQVAGHFGQSVRRYSIDNEPNLEINIGSKCNKKGQQALVRKFRGQMVRKHGKYLAKTLTKKKTLNVSVACTRYQRGVTYGKIVKASERAIHNEDASIEVLAGETSSQPGLDWFVRGVGQKNLKGVDGWAHHPFQLRDLTPAKPNLQTWGMGNLKLVKKVVKKPLYFTEFGYPHPNSSFDKYAYGRRLSQEEVADALVAAWKVAKKAGAKEMLQYQWFLKPTFRTEYWETALLDHDDGALTPAYLALQKLILDWYPPATS